MSNAQGDDHGVSVDSIVAELDAEKIFRGKVKKDIEAANEELNPKYAKIGEKVADKDLEDKADDLMSEVLSKAWKMGGDTKDHIATLAKTMWQYAPEGAQEKFYAAVKKGHKDAAKVYFQEALEGYLTNQSREKSFRKAEKLEGSQRMQFYQKTLDKIGGDDLSKVAGKQEGRQALTYLADLEQRAKRYKTDKAHYSHN